MIIAISNLRASRHILGDENELVFGITFLPIEQLVIRTHLIRVPEASPSLTYSKTELISS
ncbi:hypothetical protein BpHYR1_051816 [Brachionus plicatilis]|uniref:Uncharacterized protein n=1 Tax=Brachionus plicatilis TaxID=10195 RepID=A0A3M7P5D6_BRAPC|nr:hypothetical protein BpHYR1_051816 [Brachionus plicatilis]